MCIDLIQFSKKLFQVFQTIFIMYPYDISFLKPMGSSSPLKVELEAGIIAVAMETGILTISCMLTFQIILRCY